MIKNYTIDFDDKSSKEQMFQSISQDLLDLSPETIGFVYDFFLDYEYDEL